MTAVKRQSAAITHIHAHTDKSNTHTISEEEEVRGRRGKGATRRREKGRLPVRVALRRTKSRSGSDNQSLCSSAQRRHRSRTIKKRSPGMLCGTAPEAVASNFGGLPRWQGRRYALITHLPGDSCG